jgi:hypothetical protein
MAGRPGRGGQNRIDVHTHLLRGTFRRERHQAALDAQAPVWIPTTEQLAALGPAGRTLIDRLRTHFELNAWEGELVIEAAVISDRLAEIRILRAADPDVKTRLVLDKTEQNWSKQLANLLLALRVR